MNEPWKQELIIQFKDLFPDFEGEVTTPIQQWNIECREGWRHILFALLFAIQNEIYFRKAPKCKVIQVKEKWGGLTVYLSEYNNALKEILVDARDESYHTCERCEEEGELRNEIWVQTLCDDCHRQFKEGLE